MAVKDNQPIQLAVDAVNPDVSIGDEFGTGVNPISLITMMGQAAGKPNAPNPGNPLPPAGIVPSVPPIHMSHFLGVGAASIYTQEVGPSGYGYGILTFFATGALVPDTIANGLLCMGLYVTTIGGDSVQIHIQGDHTLTAIPWNSVRVQDADPGGTGFDVTYTYGVAPQWFPPLYDAPNNSTRWQSQQNAIGAWPSNIVMPNALVTWT